MFTILAVVATSIFAYIVYAFTSSQSSQRRTQIAFRDAENTQRAYNEAWDKQTVVWDIYAAHSPTGHGYQHDVVRLAPKQYSISDPQVVRTVFASAPKTSFYTENFSHTPLPTIAFEMAHNGDAQRRKTQTGGFLRLQNWEWTRVEKAAVDVCQRMSVGLEAPDNPTSIDTYDQVGAACMELGMRAMMGDMAPSLVPLNALGRTFLGETSGSYNGIGCSQAGSPEPASSSLDSWCAQAFRDACKIGEEGPRILQSLRKYANELGREAIPTIAAGEVSDDTAASHLCGILCATLLQRLADHPDWQYQIHTELAQCAAGLSPEQWLRRPVLSSCKILGAVFWETLRLSPPVAGPQPRVLVDENNPLCTRGIEPGCVVTASAYVVNRSGMFGQDPGRWDPQRWLEASDETVKTWRKYIFTFGSGPRACEGTEIAKFICLAVTAWAVVQYRITTHIHGIDPHGGFIGHPRAKGNGAILPLKLDKRL